MANGIKVPKVPYVPDNSVVTPTSDFVLAGRPEQPINQSPQVDNSDDFILAGQPALEPNYEIYKQVRDTDPNHNANVFKISDQIDAHPDMVSENIKQAEAATKYKSLDYFQRLKQTNPKVTKFLNDPKNMAMSHDEIQNMADHESLINKFGSAASGSLETGFLQEEQAMLGAQQLFGASDTGYDAQRLGGVVTSGTLTTDTNIERRSAQIKNRLAELEKNKPSGFGGTLYGIGSFIPQVAGAAGYGAKYAAGYAGLAALAGAETGPLDIPIAATAAGVGFAAGRVEYNFKFMAGAAYNEFKDIPNVDPNVAKIAAIASGAAASGLEFINMSALVSAIPGGKQFLAGFESQVSKEVLSSPSSYASAMKNYVLNTVQAAAHGGAAMAGITAANIAGGEAAKFYSGVQGQYKEPGQMLNEVGSSFAEGASMFGLVGAAGGAPGAYSEAMRAKQTADVKATYLAIGKTAEQNRLRQNYPEKYKEFVSKMTEDGPVQNIFIPVDAVNKIFEGKDVPVEAAMDQLGVRQSYEEAKASGGDLQIPLETWASKIVGTEYMQAMADDVKFSSDGWTNNQLKEREATKQQEAAATQTEIDKKASALEKSGKSTKGPVFQDISTKLIEAGVAKNLATNSALVAEARYETMSKILGRPAEDLYKESIGNIVSLEKRYDIKEDPNNPGKFTVAGLEGMRSFDSKEAAQKAAKVLHENYSALGPGVGGMASYHKISEKTAITITGIHTKETPLHEFAHAWEKDIAKYTDEILKIENKTPEQKTFLEDSVAILDWMGVNSFDKIDTARREKFAEAFTDYLKEGNAPSTKLARVFDRFKKWIGSIFRDNPKLIMQINSEMRGIFDRMLATGEEISQAKELAGITDELKNISPESSTVALNDIQAQATSIAEKYLLAKQIPETTEKHKQFLIDEKVRLTDEATKQVSDMPVFKASAELAPLSGKKGVPELAEKFLDGKLKDDVTAKFEELAELNDFASGKDLAESIIHADKADLFNKEIQARVDSGMKQHADMMNTDKIKIEAMKAIHNEKFTELLAMERAVLSDLVQGEDVKKEVSKRKRIDAKLEAEAAKAQARETLSKKPLKEATQARTYITGERNAAIKAKAAIDSGDYEKAAKHKSEQMLNHALAAEAMRNKVEAESSMKVFTKYANRGRDLMDMPYGFIKQVDALLVKHGLIEERPVEDKANQKIAEKMRVRGQDYGDIANLTGQIFDGGQWRSENLGDFLSRVNNDYTALSLPDSVLSLKEKKASNLTMGELRDVTEAIKSIAKVGKNYDRFLSEFIKLDVKSAAIKFGREVTERVGIRYKNQMELGYKNKTKVEKTIDAIKNIPDNMISSMVNMSTLTEYLGPIAKEMIYNPMKRAEDKKIIRFEKMRDQIHEISKKHFTDKEMSDLKTTSELKPEVGQVLSGEQVLSMILNWGNDGNKDRLMVGEKLTKDQVESVIFKADKKYWDFAQDIWNLIDTLYPDVAALEREVRGSEPKKVEAVEVNTPHGVYKGGYYPIAYDYNRSVDAYKDKKQTEALYKQVSTSSSMTERGHAEARAAYVNRPLDLSLNVMFSHVENVIHDLEFRKAVIDVNKLLRQTEVKEALQNTIGVDGIKTINDWVTNVATQQGEPLEQWQKAARWFRFNSTFATLAYKFKAFPMDITGNTFNAINEIGPTRFAKAAINFMTDSGSNKNFVRDNSPRMRKRADLRERDLNDMARKWGEPDSAFKQFGMFFQHFADEAVSYPLWLEVYNHALGEHGHDGALNLADDAVTRTIGSGSILDQVGAQRGSEFKKAMSMYYSWSSMMFNRMWLDGKLSGLEYKSGNAGAALAIMAKSSFMLWGMQAANENFWRELFRNPTEGEDKDKKAKRQIARLVNQPFSYLWGIRDLSGFVINQALNMPNYSGVQVTPLESAAESVLKTVGHTVRLPWDYDNPKEMKKYADEASRSAAQILGYPQTLNDVAYNYLDYVHGNGQVTWKDAISRRTKH